MTSPAADSVIAQRAPDDGRAWEAQCARCGSSVVHEHCASCGGDGFVALDEQDFDLLDDQRPQMVTCGDCHGVATWCVCGSGEEWCRAHPMPDREPVEPGAIEWFVVGEGSL